MNTKIIVAAVLGLVLVISTAAAQNNQNAPSPLLVGGVTLAFEGAVQSAPNEYWVQCGTECNLIAKFNNPVTDFAILAGAYQPTQPLEWSVICIEPMPATNFVSMGGSIPAQFAGCCFAFLALGSEPKCVACSEKVVLHIK